ncbi:hypothetical protein FHX42_000692 [Saccharopolyspora lacisalsi]|uniref:Uncharacterized protein n=1 Tax=Halosaccharopolyspora lacisalsi TaxID=1000566 RepID=A0A839DQL6_9PSEU|nr:hypothetical protein [Halosaccharopolyspora lacisalsi]
MPRTAAAETRWNSGAFLRCARCPSRREQPQQRALPRPVRPEQRRHANRNLRVHTTQREIATTATIDVVDVHGTTRSVPLEFFDAKRTAPDAARESCPRTRKDPVSTLIVARSRCAHSGAQRHKQRDEMTASVARPRSRTGGRAPP